MKEGFAPVDTAELFYRESGTGDPVLFIHAGVADSRMWLPQLREVPSGYRFIAYDLRGFGKSQMVDGEYSDHLDALGVMDHLGVETAMVVGCSVGSAVAIRVAATSPERVAGLVLVGADSPGFEPSEPYEFPEWPAAVAAFEAGDMAKVAQLDAKMWLAGEGRTVDEIDPGLVDQFVEMDLAALKNESARDRVRRPGPDLLDSLGSVTCPLLVVVGAHDLPTLVGAAHHLAAKHSQRKAVVIPDTAHLPGFESPQEFNETLFRFLRATSKAD